MSPDQNRDDLPWNDVPADDDVPVGAADPDPAEVEGDEGEEYDTTLPDRGVASGVAERETLDQRLAEEEPDLPVRGGSDPATGDLQAGEERPEDAETAEADSDDFYGETGEEAAEVAAVHTRPEDEV
jgi:hypothetical protein